MVRQESPQPLATLRLTSTVLPAGASLPEETQPATTEAASSVAAGVSPFLAPRTLTIDENLEDSASVLTFDLVLPDFRERFEHVVGGQACRARRGVPGLDEAWRLHRVIPSLRERSVAFQAELRTIGARLACAGVAAGPARLAARAPRRARRAHDPDERRDRHPLGAGAHLGRAPTTRTRTGRGFLGRAGLVRWVYNTPHPRDLRIRAGAAYHLVPEYADPRLALPNSVLELDALVPFGAQAITPSDGAALSRLLSSGEVDLLHFAGHGRCDDTADPPVREMLLADYVPQTELAQGRQRTGRRTCWSLDDLRAALPDRPPLALADPGPLVVINACRLGQPPSRRSEAGGFAESFLRAGAGAFVGCLWSVGDEPARAFVEEFYARLDAGRHHGPRHHRGTAGGPSQWRPVLARLHRLRPPRRPVDRPDRRLTHRMRKAPR